MPALAGVGVRATGRARSLIGACHPEPTLAVTALSIALAASSGRDARGTVLVGLAVLAGQLTVGWHNDWVDAERDAVAVRADKPVARGDITRSTVGISALVAGVATVPLSLASGYAAGAAHIAAVGLALAYNARLKGTLWSFLPYCSAFPLLVAFIALGRHAGRWPPVWALAGAALLGVGAHLANAAPDIDDDAVAGLRGLPQRLGRRRSLTAAVVLFVLSTVDICAGAGLPAWAWASLAGVGAAGVVFGAALVLASRARRHGALPGAARLAGKAAHVGGRSAWFRAAMLVALVNVALLVAKGAAL